MKKQILLTFVFLLFGVTALIAQRDPGCGDPTVCCTCRTWTITGPTNPAANTPVVYTVTPGPSPNSWEYVKGHTVFMVITATTLFKVEVDGVLQMFNAGTTKVFEKVVPGCAHQNDASVSWTLNFYQGGRSGTISLLDKSSCHDSAGFVQFVTQ
jgi:hypothetical protein